MLVSEARKGETVFDLAASSAERLATTAGAARSESWIAAQEALTAAVAARRPTADAIGDIDELSASALQNHGGLSPRDLRAINDAADEIATIDDKQAQRIARIQKRLGL